MTPKHEIDLSNCYAPKGEREFDRNSVEGIRKSLGHCHDVNQALIRNQNTLQRSLMNLKLRNGLIVAVVTGILARAPEIWGWLLRIRQ